MKTTINTIHTPFTLDSYSTFTLDIEEQEIEYYNEKNRTDYSYDNFEWTYRTKEYLAKEHVSDYEYVSYEVKK